MLISAQYFSARPKGQQVGRSALRCPVRPLEASLSIFIKEDRFQHQEKRWRGNSPGIFEIFSPKPSVAARERVPISSSYLFLFTQVVLFCCYQLPGAQLNPILLTFQVSVERTFTVFLTDHVPRAEGSFSTLGERSSMSIQLHEDRPCCWDSTGTGSKCASLFRFAVSVTLSGIRELHWELSAWNGPHFRALA